MSEIGKRFKELIVASNETNKSFASKINVNANYISMLINGRKPVSDSILYSIKKILPNFNEDWLKSGKGSMFINANNSNSQTLEEKFSTISDDEFALYFAKHKERLMNNEMIKIIVDKVASELYIEKLKDDIRKLSDNA
jgi:transcriptional regulator with XRE-family HTH domain